MGEVYRGHNIQTGDPVAIKIVLPEFARDPRILALVPQGSLASSTISRTRRSCATTSFAIDPAMGRPYLAMEFVDGLSLVDMSERGPMSPQDARATAFAASPPASPRRMKPASSIATSRPTTSSCRAAT